MNSSKAHPAVTRYPSPIITPSKPITNQEKIDAIENSFQNIMEILGLDLNDESLRKTPKRLAEMYVNEIFSGLDPATFPEMTFIPHTEEEQERSGMVLVKAGFISFCEHHFVPMIGQAYVAYIPKKKLIGLSKIPRLIRYFAHRPQLQERLTGQVADSLATLLETDDVAVVIKAKHYCVLARGVKDHMGVTTTHKLQGRFYHDESMKREFFEGIKSDDINEIEW